MNRTGKNSSSSPRPLFRAVISTLLIIAALLVAGYGLRHFSVRRGFRNPIAFTVDRGRLFVLEKEKNTILKLALRSPEEPMLLAGRYRIEKDDPQHYYMVRELYPGPQGVVVHSYIYDQATGSLLGYRFREYRSFRKPPREIFTIFLKDPQSFPELSYACDEAGNHWFVNDCAGQYNIWRVPAAGNVVMREGKVPPEVAPLGEKNEVFTNWTGICIGPGGDIYLSSGDTGRVMQYSPRGRRLREIGTVGFKEGRLLAPVELTFISILPDTSPSLTVASTGNRTWVQFTPEGKPFLTLTPCSGGYRYSDILVGAVYPGPEPGRVISFDLVNRCLVTLDRGFPAVSDYRERRPGLLSLLGGAAVFLLLPVFFYPRLAVLANRLRFPFFLKLLLLFIPILVLSALVVGDWVKDEMKNDLEAEYIRRSENLARAIMNTLPLPDLRTIQNPEDRESAAYERIHEAVNRILDREKVEYTPKWIIHKIRDGQFYFGISIWRGPIYEPYIIPEDRRIFFNVLEEKICRYGRFRDEQGEWFSYLTPILNEAGEVGNVLELYRPAEELDRADRRATRQVYAIVGVTALVSIVLVFIFSYIFTRPVRKLRRATELVSAGNFDHKIEVSSRDEMSDLAQAFNRMVVRLKQYIADLARTTAEKERIESELRLARNLQQSLLPKVFPPFRGAENIEIFARMEPAREVGGDFYDFFMVDRDHIGAVVADVSGKGIHAGLFMMEVRTLLRNKARDTVSAAAAIAGINRQLASDNPSTMFVTIFYIVCDMKTGRVSFCNAGHNPPVLLREGAAELFPAKAGFGQGMAVGVLEEAEYSDGELVLNAGESLIVYTDGVTEPFDINNRMYGEERLIRCIEENARLSSEEIWNKIYREVSEHQKGREQFDDITMLFFKYLG